MMISTDGIICAAILLVSVSFLLGMRYQRYIWDNLEKWRRERKFAIIDGEYFDLIPTSTKKQ
jgi:hypothetical protein